MSGNLWGILQKMEFPLQDNRKIDEGANGEDRKEYFEMIDIQSQSFLRHGYPVISVDCEKKENLENFKNGEREWAKKGKLSKGI